MLCIKRVIKTEEKTIVDIFVSYLRKQKQIKVNIYFMNCLTLSGTGPDTKSYGLTKYVFNRFFHKYQKSLKNFIFISKAYASFHASQNILYVIYYYI